MPPSSRPHVLLLVLFALSGFAGLSYQSLWTYYLGLLLGHAAYAQALCLCVYMGGMAAGAFMVSRITQRIGQPLKAYGWAEISIGGLGLLFHGAFVFLQDTSTGILPHLPGAWAVAYQWAVSSLLLLPQSVLLGATFPLMAAGVSRTSGGARLPELGWLYASNCLGGAIGILATTLGLVLPLGTQGAMQVAACVNLLVGAGALLWVRTSPSQVRCTPPTPKPTPTPRPGQARTLGIVALLTGATSFVYEIIWVRLLSQALGTTTHSFEIMVASFILGLSLGGWWISRTPSHQAMQRLARAQLWMGLAAILSLVFLEQAVDAVGWIRHFLQTRQFGYGIFNAVCIAVSLLIMLPATFFAGQTLPLITSLLTQGEDDRPVGRIYALNTVGAIVGVGICLNIIIPLLGLRGGLWLAAGIDIAIALLLVGANKSTALKMAAVACCAGLVVVLVGAHQKPWLQTQAAQQAEQLRTTLFAQDGKTASVVVWGEEGSASIATNLKADAAMALDMKNPPESDEITMYLLAAAPLAAAPSARQVAVVGWGSGLSTHALLGNTHLESVKTIEIEPAMVEGARVFGSRVDRAYRDPRSQPVIEDARTYFAATPDRYDIIVSEPSNPWVSGVAGLFTQEFYQTLDAKMTSNGVLSQWLHTYGLDDALLARMIGAQLAVFPRTQLFVSKRHDIVLLSRKGDWQWAPEALQYPSLQGELGRVALDTPEKIQAMLLAGPHELATFVKMQQVPPHRDFYPVIGLEAPRTRYERKFANGLLDIMQSGFPVREAFDDFEPGIPNPSADMDTANAINTALATKDARHPLVRLSSKRVPDDQVGRWAELATSAYLESAAGLDRGQRLALWRQASWLSGNQPDPVREVAALLEAMARNQKDQWAPRATALLGQGYYSQATRERLFLIAMLGHVAENQCPQAQLLWGTPPGRLSSQDYPGVRQLLGTWVSDCKPLP